VRIIHERVYLVHQTAKEFLLRPSKVEQFSSFSWEHCLQLSQIHLELARICIWYLSFDEFLTLQLPQVSDNEIYLYSMTDPHAHQHEFLGYASNHWGAHLRVADTTAGSDLLQSALRLVDTHKTIFQSWFQLYWISIARVWEFPDGLTPLMIASHLGIRQLVVIIMKDEVDPNIQDKEGWTAMHWAVWEGHGVIWDGSEAVKQLLASGALPTVSDKQGMPPLHWAAADGQEHIVRLLLNANAPVDTKDYQGSTALHLAAENGHVGVLELLADHGADMNAVDSDEVKVIEFEEAKSTNPSKRKREEDE
jgi:ankyrin repeat protein